MSKKPIFSLDDFKKWMEEQEVDDELCKKEQSLIGSEVQPKISIKKLTSKINAEEGGEEELSKEFVENGGTVLECADKRLLIQVKSGSFYLHNKYVEPKD